jgi:catalase
LTDPEIFWSFIARAPEAMHFITWLYSDVGTVKSFRHIRGFGINTYVWKNAQGIRRYVKYHWIPLAGAHWLANFHSHHKRPRAGLPRRGAKTLESEEQTVGVAR